MNTADLSKKLTIGDRYQLRKIFSLLCLFAVIFVSCSSSSTGSGDTGGNNNGDNGTAMPDPTFTNVNTIFSGNCATSGCHDHSTKQNGVDLSSYDAAIASVGNQYGKKVIQPNDAANSPLVDKISSNNPQHGVRMPYGGSPLSSDDISLIKQWIDNGAKNN
ncbi:MAG TPA: c-type cytochrome domain-containing protein [Balneolaceae bacterium]|nr:c-type cytochrome domain-containing protein [Balneolaceae bacterium]